LKLDLQTLFPYNERLQIWKKSNIMFKKDIDSVLKFWRRHADPLRGTIIKAYNKFLLVSHTEPNVVHVSDIVKMIIYNDSNIVSVLDEKKVRILARGILYHELFRMRFGDRIKAVFEFPISWHIGSYILVGNVDMIIPTDDGYYIVELKSSNTETTINFGIIQVKMYWCVLKHFYNMNIIAAYVSTYKQDIEVVEPMTKRELRSLVKMYVWRMNRASSSRSSAPCSSFYGKESA